MCGQDVKSFLRRISIGSLLFLALSLPSLSADALSELQAILTSYEQTTESLSNRLSSYEQTSNQLSISIGSMTTSLQSLENNSAIQKTLLDNQKSSLTELETISKDSEKQIVSLQTGYKSMERDLKIFKNIAIGTGSLALLSILLNVIMILST